MAKRVKGMVLTLVLLVLGVTLSWRIYRASDIALTLSELFPYGDLLRQMQVDLKYQMGQREQNGIFVGENLLMKNVQEPNIEATERNVADILSITQTMDIPSHLVLLPTACAILQSQTPYPAVAPLYDQRAYIDRVYRSLAGSITVTDVYPTLFNHQQEAIYYRTHHGLTGLGGYYVYTVIAPRLGQPVVRGLEQFTVTHREEDFYGNLYQMSPLRNVESDKISLYRYIRQGPGITVTRWEENGTIKRYYDMYPEWEGQLGTPLNILFGGNGGLMEISLSTAPSDRHLLIVADGNVLSYLPFLLTHYGKVTVVNPALAAEEILAQLDTPAYHQVLFCVSVDDFLQKPLFTQMTAWIDEE